jgi:hypothetical protein
MEEQKKTHWKSLINLDYIGAYSIQNGKDLVVTIEKVSRDMVTGTAGKKEECSVAHLKNQKPFILNRTNQKMIAKVLGTPYVEEWAGKSISLYVAYVKAFGEDNVECLRVRPSAPSTKLPDLLKSDKAIYEKVVKALSSGGYSIDQIKTKYNISKEVESDLISDAKKLQANAGV